MFLIGALKFVEYQIVKGIVELRGGSVGFFAWAYPKSLGSPLKETESFPKWIIHEKTE